MGVEVPLAKVSAFGIFGILELIILRLYDPVALPVAEHLKLLVGRLGGRWEGVATAGHADEPTLFVNLSKQKIFHHFMHMRAKTIFGF